MFTASGGGSVGARAKPYLNPDDLFFYGHLKWEILMNLVDKVPNYRIKHISTANYVDNGRKR